MKTWFIFLLSGTLLLSAGKLPAQKNVKDTLAYLKRLETNKEKYIGKPFSLLLKDMASLPPRKAKSEISEGQLPSLLTTLFIFSGKTTDSSRKYGMVIRWKKDDEPVAPIELLEQDHQYRFTAGERNFFEKKIIRDLMVSQ